MSTSTDKKYQSIPQFYFPKKSTPSINNTSHNLYRNAFRNKVSFLFEGKEFLTERDFVAVTSLCSLPRYMNIAFFRAIDSIDTTSSPNEQVTLEKLERGWSLLTKNYRNNEIDDLIYSILKKPGFDCITPDDFLPVLEDIVVNHPALQFLEDNVNFQERYIETVICRIFYEAHCPSGKMTSKHFCASNFPSVIQAIDPTIDLYTIHDYFSYKQFYVLYCKLWALDSDHDLSLSENDLSNYNLGTLTHRTVERIINVGHIAAFTEKATTPNLARQTLTSINYFDFIWFLLSEVDKSTPVAIDYWFRCLDTDEDGILSGYELHNFWSDQDLKLKFYGEVASENTIQFADIMRQMNDLIQPEIPGQFTLKDLKKNGYIAERFFDTFVNFDRFQVHDSHQEGSVREQQNFEQTQCEQNGQEATLLVDDLGFPVLSDWNDYADFEYERILLDESYANKTSYQNEQDEFTTEDTKNSINRNEEPIINIDSCASSNIESIYTSQNDDAVVVEEVNDPSSIGMDDIIFDTDESEYCIIAEELCDANDDSSDTSSLSSEFSITSVESDIHLHELDVESKPFGDKVVESHSSSNNLIALGIKSS